jgi:fatty acyl-CoA reductase
MVIFRPAIIGSSLEDPFPGWTDTLSAAGGLSLFVGLGLVNYANTSGKSEFDLIPVDIVTNGIIITTAHCHQFGGDN